MQTLENLPRVLVLVSGRPVWLEDRTSKQMFFLLYQCFSIYPGKEAEFKCNFLSS